VECVRLVPHGYSWDDFLNSYDQMLPVMHKYGSQLRMRNGSASIHGYGSMEFKVGPDEPRCYFNARGEKFDVKITHPNRWARILREHDHQVGFCTMVRIMLTYHVNSASPERLFSQVSST